MFNKGTVSRNLADNGFAVIEQVFSADETDALAQCIDAGDSGPLFRRKSTDLFAIRQFFCAVPQALPMVLSDRFCGIVRQLFGDAYFITKSIYFDKPGESNWFVAYHQDLTIAVREKADVDGFGGWTLKEGQASVQAPLKILADNFTVRIHLDDTTAANGALRVIPGSHKSGRLRPEEADREKEVVCHVPKGGIMIMQPLLLHASGRTTNEQKRRVIHIEFSRTSLPPPLVWSEQHYLPGTFRPKHNELSYE